MIIEEDVYLEHFGVKGMQWGVRKAGRATVVTGKAAGRATVSTAKGAAIAGKAAGRGAQKTARFVNRNRETVAKVAVGAAFVAALLAGGVAARNSRLPPMSSAQFAKTAAVGQARIANEGLGVLRVRAIDVVSREVLRPDAILRRG